VKPFYLSNRSTFQTQLVPLRVEQRKKMGGVNAARENNQQIQKQIKILENRLDKARGRLGRGGEGRYHTKVGGSSPGGLFRAWGGGLPTVADQHPVLSIIYYIQAYRFASSNVSDDAAGFNTRATSTRATKQHPSLFFATNLSTRFRIATAERSTARRW
jgi:hypothetical protein